MALDGKFQATTKFEMILPKHISYNTLLYVIINCSDCDIVYICSFKTIPKISLHSLFASELPRKAQLVQGRKSACGQVGCLTTPVELKLPALTFHPHCKLRRRWVSTWNIAVSVGLFVVDKLLEALFPSSGMCVPDEANFFQLLLTFLGHGALVSKLKELELVSLTLDPFGESKIRLATVVNMAVTVLFLELEQLPELLLPLDLLVPTKAWFLSFRVVISLGSLGRSVDRGSIEDGSDLGNING